MPHLTTHPSLHSVEKLVVPLGNEKMSKKFENEMSKIYVRIFVTAGDENEQIQQTKSSTNWKPLWLAAIQHKAPMYTCMIEEMYGNVAERKLQAIKSQ